MRNDSKVGINELPNEAATVPCVFFTWCIANSLVCLMICCGLGGSGVSSGRGQA